MNVFLWNIFLALIWAAMTETFAPTNLAAGFAVGYLILWLFQPAMGQSNYFYKVRQAMGFAVYFVWELFVASIRVAYYVVMPKRFMKPGLIAVPLDVETDFEILLLANVITLTPGSMSLDVSDDRKVLYVHSIFVDDPETLRRDIKNGFERRILELLR